MQKKFSKFPSHSIIRSGTKEERTANNAKITIEGVPERRIIKDNLMNKSHFLELLK